MTEIARMGPEPGTEEYNDQVGQIVKMLSNYDNASEREAAAVALFIPDTNYSRAAICEALKRIETGRIQ